MAKGTNIQLIGDESLLNMLKKLPTKAKDKKIWRTAARGGANPIVKSAKGKVPIDRGDLKRSIKYRNFSDSVYGGLGGYVSVSHWSESNTITNPAKASILVNNRKVKRLKKTYINFITQAAKETSHQSSAIMSQRVAKFMNREINKLL